MSQLSFQAWGLSYSKIWGRDMFFSASVVKLKEPDQSNENCTMQEIIYMFKGVNKEGYLLKNITFFVMVLRITIFFLLIERLFKHVNVRGKPWLFLSVLQDLHLQVKREVY